MADKHTEGGIHIEEGYSKVETFFEENQNLVTGVLGAIILVVAGFVIYGRFIKAPKEAKAEQLVYKAQQWFEADSFNLALEGDGNYYGFYDIRDEFGGTRVGKASRYYIGICNLHLGNYEEAIEYLKKFKSKDPNVQAVAYGATGDAYAQLDDLSSAVDMYRKAGQTATIGSVAPVYYLRAGKALEQLDDSDAARKMYDHVVKDYPEAPTVHDAKKNIARLDAMLQ